MHGHGCVGTCTMWRQGRTAGCLLHCSPPYSSNFGNNCCRDRFFFSIFALFLDTIHACMQFVLIIFTHPSLTLSNSLGTPSSSQQALLILCLG